MEGVRQRQAEWEAAQGWQAGGKGVLELPRRPGQRAAGSGRPREKGGQREEPEVESLARSLQGTRIALGEWGRERIWRGGVCEGSSCFCLLCVHLALFRPNHCLLHGNSNSQGREVLMAGFWLNLMPHKPLLVVTYTLLELKISVWDSSPSHLTYLVEGT